MNTSLNRTRQGTWAFDKRPIGISLNRQIVDGYGCPEPPPREGLVLLLSNLSGCSISNCEMANTGRVSCLLRWRTDDVRHCVEQGGWLEWLCETRAGNFVAPGEP
jgi:hypothetical protein